jgi:Cu2+-exporting ATPase
MGLERGTGAGRERLGNAAWCGAGAEPSFQLWYRHGQNPPLGFKFEDAIRPESRTLMAALAKRGIAVEMLTGDKPEIAAEIARQAGIAEWHAGIGPVGKVERLRGLLAAGERVLMVGDGINDAAAMALATVSIAPGSATDLSQRASDMVLRGASIAPIAEAVDVARKARRLVLQNFALAALYNLTAIPMAAMGIVTPLIAAATMAGSSLLVTLNALRLSIGKAP